MVDFVKVAVNNSAFIQHNDKLDFKKYVSIGTGELSNHHIAEYNGLKFKLYDNGFLLISGSLHKFNNDGIHNYNDYSYSMLKKNLGWFKESLGLDLNECRLQNIEFGVNIHPDRSVESILNRLLLHENSVFDSTFQGLFKQALKYEYAIKIYNKGAQYRLGIPVLRYELKFTKMRVINNLGIFNLQDLKGTNWYYKTEELLIKEWERVLLYEFGLQSKTEANLDFYQWSNPHYWQTLSRAQRCREKKRYRTECLAQSKGLHRTLKEQINKKWKELSYK